MKRTFFGTLILLVFTAPLWASTAAIFTSVTGKVKVKDAQGKKTRTAEKDASVVEGETITAGADAQATLQLFDGSELKVSPSTSFVLEKMQQPSLKDKVISFKLELGKLFASVKKLTSSKSSFEIEAGGVVCGVRGTEYWMDFNPTTGKVDVFVADGTVWSTADDQTEVLHAGQGGSWQDGTWTPNQPPAGNPPPANNNGNSGDNNGNNHPGFIASNPFYGFNGTGQDDFTGPLSDLPNGINGVTGGITGDGVAGLGAHINLSLQLGFPQYLP